MPYFTRVKKKQQVSQEDLPQRALTQTIASINFDGGLSVGCEMSHSK